MDWRYKAACRNEDPDLHFPDDRKGSSLPQIAAAKAVCRRCPAVTQCLNLALREKLDYGVFGGLTPSERREIRQQQELSQAGDKVWAAPAAGPGACVWHAATRTGRSRCKSVALNVDMRKPAGAVPTGDRCCSAGCKVVFNALDKTMAVGR